MNVIVYDLYNHETKENNDELFKYVEKIEAVEKADGTRIILHFFSGRYKTFWLNDCNYIKIM